MKKILLLSCLFVNIVVGQQNLFNIPSGDITHEKKIFYQHQFNVYSDKLESKAHFVYGLKNGWDIGLNVVGKGVYFSPEWRTLYNDNPLQGAVYPIAMATAQKQFKLSKNVDFNIGTQAGFNFSSKLTNKELNHFSYALGVFHFNKHSRIVVGCYSTNKMFVGQGNNAGIMLGTELQITDKFYLMADWISGRNDAGATVIGSMYNISKRVQLCGGWLIPNPLTPKPQGFVLEINVLGWDLW